MVPGAKAYQVVAVERQRGVSLLRKYVVDVEPFGRSARFAGSALGSYLGA